jgi:Right handed beta helix region
MANLFRRRPVHPAARIRLALESLEDRTVPTKTFTVTSLDIAGTGTLRNAIFDANQSQGLDTIVFAPGLSGTISLGGGGELLISDPLTITGPGAGVISISGNNASRIFNIDNGAAGAIDVSISGLTLTGGNAAIALFGGAILAQDEVVTLKGVAVTGNKALAGGGIFVGANGRLTLENSTVSGNSADFGGGLVLDTNSVALVRNSTISGNQATAGDGGGIRTEKTTITVENSRISGNSAHTEGGGIQLDGGGTAMVRDSTIADNSADLGGGVRLVGGTALVHNSTLSGNTARVGGGAFVDSDGSVTVEGGTISGNRATQSGGGLDAEGGALVVRGSTVSGNSAGSGGGIVLFGAALSSAALTVEGSTVSGNSAGSDGGGILLHRAPAAIRNSTIAFNTAGGIFLFDSAAPVTLVSTIVADNAVGAAGTNPDVSGALVATNSLIANTTGTILVAGSGGNVLGVDPLLGPLQFNGGPTKTHALLAGSSAINHGSNPTGLTFDQRGAPFLRAFGRGVDIGAFELILPGPVSPTAQSIQAAAQAIRSLQPGGARLVTAAFADLGGDFVNDIVLALKLKNGRLLVVTFDGFTAHIVAAFVPFPATLKASARVQLLAADLNGDGTPEVVLLINGGGPGVPRLSAFAAGGRRVL